MFQVFIPHGDVLGAAHPKQRDRYVDWFLRRQEALRTGRPFDEPEPKPTDATLAQARPPASTASLSAEEKHSARLLGLSDAQALEARDAWAPKKSPLAMNERRVADAMGVTESVAIAARAVEVPKAPAAAKAEAPTGELSEAEKICAKTFGLSEQQAHASRTRPVLYRQ